MQEMQQMWIQFLGREDPLKEEMATHSNILAWKIPCTMEPGGLQSMESQQVKTQLSMHTRKGQSRDSQIITTDLSEQWTCMLEGPGITNPTS